MTASTVALQPSSPPPPLDVTVQLECLALSDVFRVIWYRVTLLQLLRIDQLFAMVNTSSPHHPGVRSRRGRSVPSTSKENLGHTCF